MITDGEHRQKEIMMVLGRKSGVWTKCTSDTDGLAHRPDARYVLSDW
jgi:hypothetical protein